MWYHLLWSHSGFNDSVAWSWSYSPSVLSNQAFLLYDRQQYCRSPIGLRRQAGKSKEEGIPVAWHEMLEGRDLRCLQGPHRETASPRSHLTQTFCFRLLHVWFLVHQRFEEEGKENKHSRDNLEIPRWVDLYILPIWISHTLDLKRWHCFAAWDALNVEQSFEVFLK